MIYKILADGLVCLHFFWILFLVIGAPWGIKNKGVRLFHLFGLGLAFLIQVLDWICPLTHLEVYFRSKIDPSLAFKGSFLIYYLEKIIYLEVPHYLILIATILLCGFNLFFYLGYFRKKGIPKGVNR